MLADLKVVLKKTKGIPMSLTVWSRFVNFSIDVIKLRSFYELTTLLAIFSRLDESDRERIYLDISQKLLLEDVDLYRWFTSEVGALGKSSEEKAEIYEQMNINIAAVQKITRPGDNFA